MHRNKTARLALSDGTIFTGLAFGAEASRGGEVVFNTAHGGYQEVITDPSYHGQIVCMTSALQGNYGVTDEDDESDSPRIEGFVVREISPISSSFRSQRTLDEMLAQAGVPGISGIDTRALTRKLRIDGSINGILSTCDESPVDLIEQARRVPSMTGRNLVQNVAPHSVGEWTRGLESALANATRAAAADKHVVAIDCGMKRCILRHLVDIGCRVTVVPPGHRAEELLKLRPDGVFVSNGPGDPEAVDDVRATLRALVGRVPIFGICLGHQLLALALGADTVKLRFGHHGYNHPVKNLLTGRVEITSQNHGFAVTRESLEAAGLEVTHVNLNDQTVEGFRHLHEPLFAVQYHPEASPGPHDAAYLFDCFRMMMDSGAPPSAEQMRAAQEQLQRRMMGS